MRQHLWVLGLAMAVGAAACGDNDTPSGPARPSYREWVKIEPPGVVCGNGSQYKFFVNFSDVSDDLVVSFEPGGACWDYDSCTGKNGVRGAANPDGIPDNHMDLQERIVPFFQREYADNVTRDWNYVYVPYCTADVHTGNNEVTYTDESGTGDTVDFHHDGHAATEAVAQWMADNFPAVPKMLVTGCSAGGAGSTINYYFVRKAMPQAEHSYLLADSGPIFPAGGFSDPLHAKVRSAWNVDTILKNLPSEFDPDDFGTLNTTIADEFPDDRLAVTFFRRDFNFSIYSYERFYDLPPEDDADFKTMILDMWWADTQNLMKEFDTRDNLAYYIPYWRAFNDSHCTTAVSYAGSEIQEDDMTMYDFVDQLLDDSQPMQSYLESVQPDEDKPKN